MIIKSSWPAVRHATAKIKWCLGAGLMFGACLAAPPASHAALSYVGNGYVELSIAQTSPAYTSVPDNLNGATSGYSLGNLSIISQGQTLYLGGQIQTYTEQNGSAALFYKIGTSGPYSSINLAYSRNGVGQYYNNNLWDSNGGSNGGVNNNTTYYSVDIGSSLASGNYTVYFYFSATDTDNSIIMTDGSSSNPNSFNFQVTPVPEPVTLALPVFGGLVAIAGLSRRFFFRLPAA
jgi:hypothetical protein